MERERPILDGPESPASDMSEEFRAVVLQLFTLSKSGTRFGLDRIRETLAALGHPERAFRTVHVAGSNGKGSTSAFLANILARHGLTVGLYTSPHLVTVRERVQILSPEDIRSPGPEAWLRALGRVQEVAPGFQDLSFFEVVTAVAMLLFAESEVEAVVVEAGLGARLDATRLVPAELSILTDLSLEHTEFLGNTIESIAREEGAVVRDGRPLVAADGPPEAEAVIDDLVERAGARLFRMGTDFSPVPHRLSLRGWHQRRNAALALQAAALFLPNFSNEVALEALASTVWPGRFEVFSAGRERPPLVLDGAHNPHGVQALVRTLREAFPGRPVYAVFGASVDKPVREMLSMIQPVAQRIWFTAAQNARSARPTDLARSWSGPQDAEVVEPAAEAFSVALEAAQAHPGAVVLLTGSLYLIGELRPVVLKGGFRPD